MKHYLFIIVSLVLLNFVLSEIAINKPPASKRPVTKRKGSRNPSRKPTYKLSRKPTLAPSKKSSLPYIQVSLHGSTDSTCSNTPEIVHIIKVGVCTQSKLVTTGVNHFIKFSFNYDATGKAELKVSKYSDNTCSALVSTDPISGGYTVTPGQCFSYPASSSNIVISSTNGNIPSSLKNVATVRGYTDSTSCLSGSNSPARIQLSPSNTCSFDTITGTYHSFTCTSAYVNEMRWSDDKCTTPSNSPDPHLKQIPVGKYCDSLSIALGFIDELSYFYGTMSCENII